MLTAGGVGDCSVFTIGSVADYWCQRQVVLEIVRCSQLVVLQIIGVNGRWCWRLFGVHNW